VLRRLFGFERVGLTEGWRRLYNEDSHNVTSPDIRMTKSRRKRWVGHVEHNRAMRSECIVFAVKPEERRYIGKDRRIILKRV
jgi:hypothetical protein